MFVKAHGPSHFDPRNCWGHPRDGCGAISCLAVPGDPSMQPVRARTTLSLRQPENRSSGERLGERSSETNQQSSHPHAGMETMGSGLRILWISGGSWGISQLRRLDDQRLLLRRRQGQPLQQKLTKTTSANQNTSSRRVGTGLLSNHLQRPREIWRAGERYQGPLGWSNPLEHNSLRGCFPLFRLPATAPCRNRAPVLHRKE